MVAFPRDDSDHGGGVCPCCKLREQLALFFSTALSDGSEEWHWATGDLRLAMNEALLALDRMEADSYAEHPSDEPHHEHAAAALVRLLNGIEQVGRVMSGD